MSTLAEIEQAIEQLPPQTFLELRHWMERRGESKRYVTSKGGMKPDFLARQNAVFGGRQLSDSQAVLDEIRRDRF